MGILAQRLVRTLCPLCKQEIKINEQEWQNLTFDFRLQCPSHVFKAVGCEKCRYTGYKGRVGIYEFMPLSTVFKQFIGQNVSLNEIQARLKKEGIEPLRIAGARKVLAGLTSMEEVLSIVPLN